MGYVAAAMAADDAWLFADGVAGLPAGAPATYEVGDTTFRSDVADIRYLRVRGVEIVRRIFVTVRDSGWAEVDPVSWHAAVVDDDPEGWRLRLAARHASATTDFAWRGVLSVDRETGECAFRMSGRALDTTEVNRISVVVLHPADALVGGSFETGDSARVPVGRQLIPQLIVDGLPSGITSPFSRLVTRHADGTVVRFGFTGEDFEIEDQRNFGDSTFKTYGPPLSRGFPRTVTSGDRVDQTVTIRATLPDPLPPSPQPVRTSIGSIPEIRLLAAAADEQQAKRFFAEFNRGAPIGLPDGDLVIAVCPTVHAADALTVTENVGAVADIVATAHTLFPGHRLSVLLTFRQGPPPHPSVAALALAWVVAVAISLGDSPLEALVLDTDLVDSEGSAAPDQWRAVVDALTAPRRATEVERHITPAGIHALVWIDPDGSRRLLAANLAEQDLVEELPPFGTVRVPRGGVAFRTEGE